MNDAPLSDLLIQNSIKTENQLIVFSDYSWKDCTETAIITRWYILLFRGGTIEHISHVPVIVAQVSAENEYNSACTAGMDLSHFRVLIHELFNKDQ